MQKRSGKHLTPEKVQQEVVTFQTFTKNAEISIRENYGRGRIPPDWCGDDWDDEFAAAYDAIRPYLPLVREEYYQPPHGTAYRSYLFKAENPVQALMFLLNPVNEAFGETGYLEAAEYEEIKAKADRILYHVLNPPRELTLTQTEIDLVDATTATPQTGQQLSAKAGCSFEAARKYLPGLCERGFIIKAPKNGYYRLI